MSILLSDARTPTHSGDNENVEAQTFLAHYEHDEFGEPEHEHPNLEDSEDEGDLEINDSLKNRQDVASATILGNRTARTSTLHVGLDYADAEWGHQDLAGAGQERRDDEEGETSGLSAKAGIILVRPLRVVLVMPTHGLRAGHTQRLDCDPPVPRNWPVSRHICHI